MSYPGHLDHVGPIRQPPSASSSQRLIPTLPFATPRSIAGFHVCSSALLWRVSEVFAFAVFYAAFRRKLVPPAMRMRIRITRVLMKLQVASSYSFVMEPNGFLGLVSSICFHLFTTFIFRLIFSGHLGSVWIVVECHERDLGTFLGHVRVAAYRRDILVRAWSGHALLHAQL